MSVRVTWFIQFKLSTSILVPLHKNKVIDELLCKQFIVCFCKIFSGKVNQVNGLIHLPQLKEISSTSR